MIKFDFYSLIVVLFFNICFFITFNKSLNYKEEKKEKLLNCIVLVILSFIYSVILSYFDVFLAVLVTYLIFSLIISFMKKISIVKILSITIFSLVIVYFTYFISLIVSYCFLNLTKLKDELPVFNILDVINILFNGSFQIFLTLCFFKIKRFKKGFNFFQRSSNKYIYNLSVAVVFLFTLITMFDLWKNYQNVYSYKIYFFGFIALIFIFVISFILREIVFDYRINQSKIILKSEEEKIENLEKEVENVTKENKRLAKIIHEYSNRHKALAACVNNIINKNNLDIETANEYSDILNNINKISKEFTNTVEENYRIGNKLTSTKIKGIDILLDYMLKEAIKNNIELNLKISCEVKDIIENIIEESKLEQLIGDLIKNSIIAVKLNNLKFKNILLEISYNNGCYSITIYDNGIDFEIDTLVNLGIVQSTTHNALGGSGIGFLSIFEILNNTKGSILITEYNNNSYTKSISIIFDTKGEYIINSYRKNEIKNKDLKDRIILYN